MAFWMFEIKVEDGEKKEALKTFLLGNNISFKSEGHVDFQTSTSAQLSKVTMILRLSILL